MAGKSPSNVTMADVARLSGVSLSTVSLVLNQKPGIPHKTRLKVLAAAETLGYQLKNAVATGAKTERQQPVKTIGVFVKSQIDDPIPPTSNAFYSYVLSGIEESCRVHNLLLVLSVVLVDVNSYPIEVPDLIQHKDIDAILMVGVCINEMLDAALKQTNTPVVLVDAYSYVESYDAVVCANFEAGYQAAHYLIEKGHRDIGFIGGYENGHPSFLDRRSGYLQALQDEEIEASYLCDCSYNNPQAVFNALKSLKQENPQITAVLGCNDKVALEIMQAAIALGLDIPNDLSVMGFDNIAMADKVNPPLTTIEIDKLSMGRLAVDLVFFRSRYPNAAMTKAALYPTLVERQSVQSKPA
ncbi:MAG: LacI family DNA-binding transcriptional regulator [Anaerolineae bacterium]|nr:LacI family DNA-binding transcriptional regulator [Anaerolineae bacterium]